MRSAIIAAILLGASLSTNASPTFDLGVRDMIAACANYNASQAMIMNHVKTGASLEEAVQGVYKTCGYAVVNAHSANVWVTTLNAPHQQTSTNEVTYSTVDEGWNIQMKEQSKKAVAPKVTDIVYVIDRSGSMHDIIGGVVKSFNEYITEQKELSDKLGDECYLTLVSFDHMYEVIYDRVDIREVPKLDAEDVFPRGTTALRDAVGRAINSMEPSWNVVLMVMTDGFENASQEYSREQIKTLLDARKEGGWNIEYSGLGIEREQGTVDLGTSIDLNTSYTPDERGVADAFTSYSISTTSARTGD